MSLNEIRRGNSTVVLRDGKLTYSFKILMGNNLKTIVGEHWNCVLSQVRLGMMTYGSEILMSYTTSYPKHKKGLLTNCIYICPNRVQLPSPVFPLECLFFLKKALNKI